MLFIETHFRIFTGILLGSCSFLQSRTDHLKTDWLYIYTARDHYWEMIQLYTNTHTQLLQACAILNIQGAWAQKRFKPCLNVWSQKYAGVIAENGFAHSGQIPWQSFGMIHTKACQIVQNMFVWIWTGIYASASWSRLVVWRHGDTSGIGTTKWIWGDSKFRLQATQLVVLTLHNQAFNQTWCCHTP